MAVETVFRGVKFRSRTEARWAVFFDALHLSYEYEPKRLSLSSGETYLPDFFLGDFNAYFEVKPSSEAVVTEECIRARTLARDQPGQRMWLAMGAPNAEEANVLPLNQWRIDVDIGEILATPENRYRFMEDRRDDEVYWLQAEFVTGGFSHSYMIGGKGQSTDHERLPMIKGQILEAYKAATAAFAAK